MDRCPSFPSTDWDGACLPPLMLWCVVHSRARGKPDDGLRALLHRHLPQVHWQALELGVVGSGVPDTTGAWAGSEWWIECKATDAHAVGLEPDQIGWILRGLRSGRRIFVATRRRHEGGPRRGDACDELWLHEGHDAVAIRDGGLMAAPPVLQMEGGPSRWDWDLLLRTLVEWDLGRS